MAQFTLPAVGRRPSPTPGRRPAARGLGLAVAVVALLVAALCSILLGNQSFRLADLVAAYQPGPATDADLVLRHLRVPRTAVGCLAGMALGVSGALMQGLTRNPLADPGILGINAGAAVAVVVAISLFGIDTVSGYVWFAFPGAAVAGLVVYAVGGTGQGGTTPVKLALAGAAVTALLTGVTSCITLLDTSTLNEYRFWVVGSLAAANPTMIGQSLPFLAAGAVVATASGRALNTLAVGEELASALGLHLARARLGVAVSVVLLAGTATALAGPISFVGLVVPHVARRLAGPDYRRVLPWSMVLAPLLLLVADLAGRVLAYPQELQVGVVTAVVGAPIFVALVRRRRVAGA